MEEAILSQNYYEVLECERTASTEEIKRNYQRLVLVLHPDKQIGEKSDKLFHLIQQAWSVLRDPVSRKQYDAELSCREHSELLIYEAISLNDMNYDEAEGIYSYTCRCGGTYLLEKTEFIPSKVTISCEECSFAIEVSL